MVTTVPELVNVDVVIVDLARDNRAILPYLDKIDEYDSSGE